MADVDALIIFQILFLNHVKKFNYISYKAAYNKTLNMLELPSSTVIEVGCDEVGRGCLVFEAVAAAVVMPSNITDVQMFEMIKDSKKLSAKKRKLASNFIMSTALAFGIGVASVDEIDELNILHASQLAVHRALDKVYETIKFEHIYMDGDRFNPYTPKNMRELQGWTQSTCIPNGDNVRIDIAAASILAKVYRDELVERYVSDNPDWDAKYGFIKNKGYGTKQHMDGLKTYGILAHHRRTFAPVANCLKFV